MRWKVWSWIGCIVFVMLNLIAAAWAQPAGGDPKLKTLNPPPSLSPPEKRVPARQDSALKTKADSAPPADNYSVVFDGNELPKEWRMVNSDPARWTMQPNRKSLLIESQTSSCLNKDAKNWLFLDRPLPAADFEVIVKASMQFQSWGNLLAMVLWSDDTNYFIMQVQVDQYSRNSYFQKVFQGQTASTFPLGNVAPNDMYLKIVRESNEYSGYIAAGDSAKPDDLDQITWTKLGTTPGIRFEGKLALCAVNYRDAPAVGAEFYSVKIRSK